jgi:hypothetical protein
MTQPACTQTTIIQTIIQTAVTRPELKLAPIPFIVPTDRSRANLVHRMKQCWALDALSLVIRNAHPTILHWASVEPQSPTIPALKALLSWQ